MLIQYHFLFSPWQCNQLIWSRCVNIHWLPWRNIPADLFMEHLNRLCKEAIINLGSNKTEKAIQRVGKVIGVIDSVLAQYDKLYHVSATSGAHLTKMYLLFYNKYPTDHKYFILHQTRKEAF